MSLVQGKLIHHQPPHLPKLMVPTLVCKRRLSIPDGVPTDPGELADMADGEVLNERFNPALHAPGEAGARGEPVDMFTDATTAQTVDAANRQL